MKKPRMAQAGLMLLAFCIMTFITPLKAAPEGAQPLRLGMQAWTFKNLTFAETLKTVEELGVPSCLQAYRGQKLGEGFGEHESFDHNMSAATLDKVLALAQRHGVTLTSYGVVTGKDEAEWRQIFAFAKALGLEDISIEPKPETWPEVIPLVMRLSRESGIRFGFHNHPNPVTPAEFLKKLDAYDATLGLCADTGHWARSGWDPVASLRVAEGRLVSVHFKDLTQRALKGHDVPWGTGVLDAAGQLAELRRQKFKGAIYLEYEHRTPNLPKEVARCVEYFRRTQQANDATLAAGKVLPPGYVTLDEAGGIAPKRDAGKWPSPVPLFASDLGNATSSAGGVWRWENGLLSGTGNLLTRQTYKNFIVSLEFRCGPQAESGVLLRVNDGKTDKALEVRIRQSDSDDEKQLTGAIAHCQIPGRPLVLEPGRWYHCVIMARPGQITVLLDGAELTKCTLADWKEAGKNPDGSANPYDVLLKDLPPSGAVGLRAPSGGEVHFRNLTIEKL